PAPVRRREERPVAGGLQARGGSAAAPGAISLTIPLRITVDFGAPVAGGTGAPGGPAAPRRDLPPAPFVDDGDELLLVTEARPEDYADRRGYESGFLGAGFEIPLPAVGPELADDVQTYELDGARESELRYEHFSVVMRASRRLCFFSAV